MLSFSFNLQLNKTVKKQALIFLLLSFPVFPASAPTIFNLFDTDANDISYFYESQLPGETQPVADIHFHPVEPRTLRVTATIQF